MSTWLGQLWDETKDDVSAAWGRLSSLSSDDGADGGEQEQEQEEEPVTPRRAHTLEQMLEKYRESVLRESVDLPALRQLAFVGIPEELRVRGLFWKLLLGFLPPDRSRWESVHREHRERYQAYRESPPPPAPPPAAALSPPRAARPQWTGSTPRRWPTRAS